MTSQEVQSQVTKPPRSANKWISFLKNYSQEHNLPYSACISSAECKQEYLASKNKPVTEPTPPVVEPVEAVVEPVVAVEAVEAEKPKKSKKEKKEKKQKKKKKKNQSEHSVSEPIDIPVSE